MANVVINGDTYQNVPCVKIPTASGGAATFTDTSATTASAADVAEGKTFYNANGTLTTGTGTLDVYDDYDEESF